MSRMNDMPLMLVTSLHDKMAQLIRSIHETKKCLLYTTSKEKSSILFPNYMKAECSLSSSEPGLLKHLAAIEHNTRNIIELNLRMEDRFANNDNLLKEGKLLADENRF